MEKLLRREILPPPTHTQWGNTQTKQKANQNKQVNTNKTESK